MNKRLCALAAVLASACLLAPSAALADEGSADAVPVAIEIGSDGAPAGTSGVGWTYENGKLVLEAGHAFTLTGHPFNVSGENCVRNRGVVEGGTFVDTSRKYSFAVHNEAGGVIEGGTFTASIGNAGTIEDGAFNGSVENFGTIEGGAFEEKVDNHGAVRGGMFTDATRSKPFCYTVSNYGSIEGGAFAVDVSNYDGGTISGGAFNADAPGYGYKNSVNNGKGCTIRGGTFSVSIDNSGTIEGAAVSRVSVQNRSDGSLEGGTFEDEVYNEGIITGGTFSSTGSVTSCSSGSITGGTFAGTVVNGDEDNRDGTAITDGTFGGIVTNYAVIAGGVFERPVVDRGGSLEAACFPLSLSLNNLAIRENAKSGLFVPFAKDSDESAVFTFAADEGYALPDKIELCLERADGVLTTLTRGTDYTFDASAGALSIKKSAITGPLRLAASGVPVPKPGPDDPAPTPQPELSPAPEAQKLASTGDGASTSLALVTFAAFGSTLALRTARHRKARANRS